MDRLEQSIAHRGMILDAVDTATGRLHRDDAIESPAGGPAGNAHLTAWTGLLLFVLFAAEGLTILSIRGLFTWHVAIGAVLIPPTLLKTVTTGWRIVRYYAGRASYVQAGPPPLLLRLLGPLVVGTSLAVLATGVALILVGPDSGRSPAGLGVSWLLLHKASFIVWLVAMTLHVVARFVPAVLTARESTRERRRVPGWSGRATVLVASVLAGVALAVVLVHSDGDWNTTGFHDRHEHVLVSPAG